MDRLIMNIMSTPPLIQIPTDPQAAWTTGCVQATKLGEKIINDMLPYLDSTSKASIIERYQNHLEAKHNPDTPKTSRALKIPTPKKILSCKHPAKYVEQTFETDEYLCTMCGLREQ